MYENFDFGLLSDPRFKEDSVREELVVPILTRLGYSASGPDKIVRAQPLEHPFVRIGTKRHKVNIYPDYLLAPNGKTAWVLDAKAPNENIESGPNVEQAFSYAIHRDVRVSIYSLCNGRKLSVFHVSELEPKLVIDLSEIDRRWEEVRRLLSPIAFVNPLLLDFVPDFGLSFVKLGYGGLDTIWFPKLHFQHVAKARDDLYTLTSTFNLGDDYCASFDLDITHFQRFLELVTDEQRRRITTALSQHPWHIHFPDEDDAPRVTIGAVLAGYVAKNDNESYAPLKVVSIKE